MNNEELKEPQIGSIEKLKQLNLSLDTYNNLAEFIQNKYAESNWGRYYGDIAIDVITKLEAENKKLKEENKKLKEALAFYASEDNWTRSNKALFTRINSCDIEVARNKTVREIDYTYLEVGGKRAREVLRSLK